jgi:hypothetical protein
MQVKDQRKNPQIEVNDPEIIMMKIRNTTNKISNSLKIKQ